MPPPPAAVNGYVAAYAAAKADMATIFATPKEITEMEFGATARPPCFADQNEHDAKDPACQSCALIVPCRATILGLL